MPFVLWPLLSLGVFMPLTKWLQPRRPRLSAVFKMLATLCAAGLACSGGLPGSFPAARQRMAGCACWRCSCAPRRTGFCASIL